MGDDGYQAKKTALLVSVGSVRMRNSKCSCDIHAVF